MVNASVGRRTSLAITVLAAVAVLFATPAGSASGAPGDPTTPGNEGGAPTLGQALEEANAAWIEANAILEASKKRQAELATQVAAVEVELAPLVAEVGNIASAAYRTGGLSAAAALLSSGSTENFMDRALSINTIAVHNDRQLGKLTKLQKDLADKKAKIDQEVVTQQQQADVMAKRKKDTEKALAAAGGKAVG